jgi:hypothetical protein
VAVGILSFLGSWVFTAGTRYVAAESDWAVAIHAAGNAVWLAAIFLCPRWQDYRRYALMMVVGDLLGVPVGLRIP